MNRNSKDPYRQIFLDLKADLSYLARKHGGRLLEEAAKSATQSEVLQRLAEDLTRRTERNDGEPDETFTEETEDGEETQPEDTPPEQLDYPDEDVWTVPPAPDEEEEEGDDEHELSDAAERVLSDLMDSLKDKAA